MRYWDVNKVSTRYIGSKILGHGTAADMPEHFYEGDLECELDIGSMVDCLFVCV